QLRGAKENPQALPRPVLSLRRRRGGAAVQPAADRRGGDSGILKVVRRTNERHRSYRSSRQQSRAFGALPRPQERGEGWVEGQVSGRSLWGGCGALPPP